MKKLLSLLAMSIAFLLPSVASAAPYPVALGGTGWVNIVANSLLLGNGTGQLATTTAGTNGQFLSLIAGVPSWANATSTNFWYANGTSIYNGNAGFVGIGSTTPTNMLSLDGGSFDLNGNNGSYKEDNVTILNASTTNLSVMVGPLTGANVFPGNLGNIAVGYQALQSATTSKSNVAIGWQAMKGGAAETILSNGNVAIGAQSLMSITTGTGVAAAANTAVGSSTLRLLTTGQGNTAIGTLAGSGLTTGPNNTIVGSSAERGNVSSASAFGVNALAVSTGTGNSGFGASAMLVNTTGLNDAFGLSALTKVTTNSFNSAFGASSLASTTGPSNAGFGYNAGINLLNITSASSTFLGAFAGRGAIGGYGATGSIYIGASSGYNIASSSNWNTCIGTFSCINLSSGADNIIIGSASTSANDNLTTGSDNIKIGDNISFPSATASGQLNIGNLIFGTGLDGVGSTLSSGSIGISTTTPGSLLSVQGVANFNTATSTFYSTGGINLVAGGCYAINGTCIGGSGTVTNIATTYPLLGGPITNTGTLSIAFGTTTSNTWAGIQTIGNASTTALTVANNNITGVNVLPIYIASSTWGTGTTTIVLLLPNRPTKITSARCLTSAGTLNVQLYGSTFANFLQASTTNSTFAYSTNNVFAAGDTVKVDIGTAASSPTNVNCSFEYTQNSS